MAAELLIVLGLVLVNGLFAGAEIALLTVRKSHIQERASAGSRAARAVLKLRRHPERFLATVQIGITAVGAAAAAFGGARIARDLTPVFEDLGFGRYSDSVAFALVVMLVTFLSLVIGELVPKSLALRYSERYALMIGRPLVRLAALARPIVWFLTACSNAVLRLFGDRTSFTEARVSREDVKQVVEEAAAVGSVDQRTSEIASRALELSEISVAELMVTRDRIVALPRAASTDEIMRIIVEQGHSRMPVYDGDLDRILGYVIARDVLAQFWQRHEVRLETILRPAYTVAATARIDAVLRDLQARHVSVALVVDERGGTAGLVSVEDILEELVGEIEDELDAPEETIREESPDTALVAGWVPVRKVNRALHTTLPITRDGVTIAGLCMTLALAIPQVGTRLTTQDGTVLEVVDASARRVRKVRIHHHVRKADEDTAQHAGADGERSEADDSDRG
jgi:putative hemolysin